MARGGFVQKLLDLASALFGADEPGWAAVVLEAVRRVEGPTPTLIQDRHGVLDEAGWVKGQLLEWIGDPAPKLEGLRFRARRTYSGMMPGGVAIEMILDTPGGCLSFGFSWEPYLHGWPMGPWPNEEAREHAAQATGRGFRHELDRAHAHLVHQVREAGPDQWPTRPVRVVRRLPVAGDVVA